MLLELSDPVEKDGLIFSFLFLNLKDKRSLAIDKQNIYFGKISKAIVVY
jgi:hypothetical protein